MTLPTKQGRDAALAAIFGAVTGVMRCTQAVWEECYSSGIDLAWEEAEKEFRYMHDLNDSDDIPQEVLDTWEFEEPTFIIGDWKKGEDGLYEHTPLCNDVGYSAILGWLGGAAIVHVVWSQTVRTVASMCSPCCPGQADLDSGEGNIMAYALPEDFDWDGE